MAKKRKTYTREFKLEAVRLAQRGEASLAQIAGELGIHGNTLRAWVEQLDADPQHAFPGKGRLKPEAEEILAVRRENKRLKLELEFLKKTTAYFAKQSR
jgi:transposase